MKLKSFFIGFLLGITVISGLIFPHRAFSEDTFNPTFTSVSDTTYSIKKPNGDSIYPLNVECTTGAFSDEKSLVTDVRDAKQICRDSSVENIWYFNCKADTSGLPIYRCENQVDSNTLSENPSGDIKDNTDQNTSQELVWEKKNFLYDGKTYSGECSMSSEKNDLATCRRTTEDGDVYYLCVPSKELTYYSYKCNQEVATKSAGEDVNTLDDLGVSDQQVTNAKNQSFTGDDRRVDSLEFETGAKKIDYKSFTSFPGLGRIGKLCELLDALWILGIIVLVMSVFGMIVWGGIQYVSSGVNVAGVSEAKQKFMSALVGLILGLCSVLILSIINVNLVSPTCSLDEVGEAESNVDLEGNAEDK